MCCLLLILTVVSVVMTRQTATLSNLTAENQQLMTERSVLARETEELSRTAGNLNWTLGVIMKYDKFPVSEFCPEKSECSFLQYVLLSTQKWFSCMDDVFVSLHLTLKIKDSNPSIVQFLWIFFHVCRVPAVSDRLDSVRGKVLSVFQWRSSVADVESEPEVLSRQSCRSSRYWQSPWTRELQCHTVTHKCF